MSNVWKIRALFAVIVGLLTIAITTGSSSAAPYARTSPQIGVLDAGPCTASYVTASGKGFAPGELITVTRDGAMIGQVSANSAGAISVNVSVAGISAGTHSVTAIGSLTRTPATTSVIVRGAACSAADGTSAATTAPVPPTTVATASSGLAFTGVQVAAMSLFAIVVLVGGGLLVLAGRRRRT